MKYANINIRVPAELVQAIDKLAQDEAQRTGLRVDRSSIVRRAITEDLERRAAGVEKKA